MKRLDQLADNFFRKQTSPLNVITSSRKSKESSKKTFEKDTLLSTDEFDNKSVLLALGITLQGRYNYVYFNIKVTVPHDRP